MVQRRNIYELLCCKGWRSYPKATIQTRFQQIFCEEYGEIKDKALLCFIENWITDRNVFFTPLRLWQHNNAKEEWQGKYTTTYNANTGRFIYGVYYSIKSERLAMVDFFKLLQEMSQEVIFTDYVDDFMIDEEVNYK